MPTNNYGMYSQKNKSGGFGGKILIIAIIVAAIAGGYYMINDTSTGIKERRVSENQSTTSPTTVTANANEDSIDNLYASVEAALQTDDSDLNAIQKEFKQ